MISLGNRRQGSPILIKGENTTVLERVPLDERQFQENWLQNLIDNNPQLLPIDDIESGFAPLISVGREIATSVGYIDNLFISTSGYITLVETKLWRNPEAKREVVGQIIDYAKELSNWDYSMLDNAVKLSSQNNLNIIKAIKKYDDVDAEQEKIIIDNVNRNLKRGRILLLIVGDGIRESVEEMIVHLNKTSLLQYTFGLIELQIYKKDNEFIIVPNLIERTREITRAIIRIENSSDAKVVVETNFEEKTTKAVSKGTLSQIDFFEILKQNTNELNVNIAKEILEKYESAGYIIEWKQATFICKITDPMGSGSRITIFMVSKNGDCYIGWSAAQLKRLGLDVNLAYNFCQKTVGLFNNVGINRNFPESWNRWILLTEIRPVLEEFFVMCNEFVEEVTKDGKRISTNN